VETSGIEPPTPSLRSNRASDVSPDSKTLTPTPSAACTCACTSEGKNVDAGPQDAESGQSVDDGSGVRPDPLAAVAAAISALSPADRMKLAKMRLNG
jgi:hypothetical protein